MRKTLLGGVGAAIVAGSLFIFSFDIVALEVPLKKGIGQGGTTVGFVDMETIFQEYPETQKAKKEYYEELGIRRGELAQQEKELADLREQLAVLRTTLQELQAGLAQGSPAAEVTASTGSSTEKGGEVPSSLAPSLGVSTGSIAAVKESLIQREKTLREKEVSLEQARAQSLKAMETFEERRSLQILGKLYNALVQLAEEQGISLVVDKSSILYGQEAMDLTERLRRRVRGLPDVDFEE